jgi:hypothetical protein
MKKYIQMHKTLVVRKITPILLLLSDIFSVGVNIGAVYDMIMYLYICE